MVCGCQGRATEWLASPRSRGPYLLIFPVASLDHSSCHFLLLPQGPALLEDGWRKAIMTLPVNRGLPRTPKALVAPH